MATEKKAAPEEALELAKKLAESFVRHGLTIHLSVYWWPHRAEPSPHVDVFVKDESDREATRVLLGELAKPYVNGNPADMVAVYGTIDGVEVNVNMKADVAEILGFPMPKPVAPRLVEQVEA